MTPSILFYSSVALARYVLPMRGSGFLARPCRTRSIRLDEAPDWTRHQIEDAIAAWASQGFEPAGQFALVTVGFYSHVVFLLRERGGPLLVEITSTEIHASGEAPRHSGAACFALLPGPRRIGAAAHALARDPDRDEVLRVLPKASTAELLAAARDELARLDPPPGALEPKEPRAIERELRALHEHLLERMVERRLLSPPSRLEIFAQTLTGLRLDRGQPGRPCLRCGDLDDSTLSPGHDGVCDRCLPDLIEHTQRRARVLEIQGFVASILTLGAIFFLIEWSRGVGRSNLQLLVFLVLGGAAVGSGFMLFDQRVLRRHRRSRG